jgi:hypothetical protein
MTSAFIDILAANNGTAETILDTHRSHMYIHLIWRRHKSRTDRCCRRCRVHVQICDVRHGQ